MILPNHTKAGFVYRLKLVDAHGNAIHSDTASNLIPSEGLDHMQSILFAGDTAPATLYVGLYKGNYTPTPDVTAATIAGLAQEFTSYAAVARPAIAFGPVAGGYVATSTEVEFDFTGSASIYGGFVSTSSVKDGTSGVLWSAARFPSPKPASADLKMMLSIGFMLVS